jgi:hypothetical protein
MKTSKKGKQAFAVNTIFAARHQLAPLLKKRQGNRTFTEADDRNAAAIIAASAI